MTIAGGFRAHATRTPDRDAVILDRRVSYGELLRGATAVGRALTASFGRTPATETRIAVLLDNGPRFLEIFEGAALAGVPVMVFDPDWSEAELTTILTDVPPSLLFCETATAVTTGRMRPGTVIEVAGSRYQESQHQESPYQDQVSPYRDWLRTDDGAGQAAAPPAAVPDTATFYVGFTSGSTGRPKGVVRTHRSWLRTFDRYADEFGIDEHDHILLPGSLGHSHFLFGAVHGLHTGATVHLMRRFDAAAVFDILARDPVSVVYLVPTMVEALLDYARRQPAPRFERVRSLLSVGAKWSAASRARAQALFPAADAVEFYGATELSLVSVMHGDDDGPRDSVGRPVAGVEVSIRAADGREVETGEIGQVYVRSDMLFSHYLSPDDTGAPDRDGWFSVGDIGRLDGGYLHLVGRARDMLITGGVNVYPEEIEGALARLDEIAQVAAVGLEDEYWGDLVCAVVVWRDGARLDLARLRDLAAAHLSRQKCPRRLFEMDSLPYTPSGKVDRRRVRALLRDGDRTVREVR